ncbi:hypothetical protein BDZ97DRAFT_1836471 [Flammula alnicola]|nr:hypothetical protein BDZ97DRAFT_1836471 [Flammula alnicola]
MIGRLVKLAQFPYLSSSCLYYFASASCQLVLRFSLVVSEFSCSRLKQATRACPFLVNFATQSQRHRYYVQCCRHSICRSCYPCDGGHTGFHLRPHPRSDGTIFMCTDANSGGTCDTVAFTFEQCSSIPAAINDAVSSLQTPAGTLCTLFENGGCSGHFIHVVSPGEPNLGNNNFNDVLSSFICIPVPCLSLPV